MKKQFLKWMPALVIAALVITGCKKDKEETDSDTSIASENSFAEAGFNDVANVADQAYMGNTYKLGPEATMLSACATVVIDTVSVPHTLTITFGGDTTHCLCNDGNYRKGTIIVSWSGGKYTDPGHVHSFTLDDYFWNFNQILGTKTVTNNGYNANGNLTYSVVVTGGQIIIDPQYGGGTITWESTRTREWVAGSSTSDWKDDVYMITGSASGTTKNGTAYTMNIVTALEKALGCKHFKTGVLDITPAGKATRTIDYSYLNGNCDNLATVTINGVTKTIILPWN